MRDYVALLKLRIGLMVTLSAVAGALTAGAGIPPARALVLLALATALASAGASALNHYYDRDVDAVMERTRHRPLPAGAIPPGHALWLGIGLAAAGVALALAVHPAVSLYLGLGALVYVVVYTLWLKRRSPWNIVIGGLAGSLAVLAGGAAATADLALRPPVLALAAVLFLWTPPHFWSLAIARQGDYRRAGIPMLPVVVGGRRTAGWIAAHTVTLVGASLLLAWLVPLGPAPVVAVVGAGAFFLRQNLALLREASAASASRNFRWSLAYLLSLLLTILLEEAGRGAGGPGPAASGGGAVRWPARWELAGVGAVLLLTVGALPAAGQGPWTAPAEAKERKNPLATAAGVRNGRNVFQVNCVPCHGPQGKGDGPAAAALSPKPKNLTERAVQAQTDGELFWKISGGRGPMPAWQHLPEDQRWSLVHYLRDLAPKR